MSFNTNTTTRNSTPKKCLHFLLSVIYPSTHSSVSASQGMLLIRIGRYKCTHTHTHTYRPLPKLDMRFFLAQNFLTLIQTHIVNIISFLRWIDRSHIVCESSIFVYMYITLWHWIDRLFVIIRIRLAKLCVRMTTVR